MACEYVYWFPFVDSPEHFSKCMICDENVCGVGMRRESPDLDKTVWVPWGLANYSDNSDDDTDWRQDGKGLLHSCSRCVPVLMYLRVYIYIYTCIHIITCIYTSLSLYMCVYMYISLYIYIYIYICKYIYIYIYTQ